METFDYLHYLGTSDIHLSYLHRISSYTEFLNKKNEMETTTKLTDGSFMPIGKKYLGVKLINVPAQYLLWLYDNGLKHQGLKEYIEDNMDALKQGK